MIDGVTHSQTEAVTEQNTGGKGEKRVTPHFSELEIKKKKPLRSGSNGTQTPKMPLKSRQKVLRTKDQL